MGVKINFQSLPIPPHEQERIAWLRLIRTESIGPVTFYSLLEKFGSAGEALYALPELAKKSGRKKMLSIFTEAHALKELDALKRYGARLILASDQDYPLPLKTLSDAPPILSAYGATSLNQPILGIVGARNASLNGQRFAGKIAKDLGNFGWVIVSGLARGIDAAAHKGALETGTVAVVAGGIDHIYPPENAQLYRQISEKGIIISEVPFGTAPQSTFFPRRNRIISGIARGIVIIEAAFKSGSLITARTALDQGREIFAVPGSPFDPRSQGSNHLIRQGAILVQSANDIVDSFSGQFSLTSMPQATAPIPQPAPISEPELSSARKSILENLNYCPIALDELVRQCQMSLESISLALLELELAERIRRYPGNRVALAFNG